MDVDFLHKSRVFSFYDFFFASLPNFWKKRVQIYIAKKWGVYLLVKKKITNKKN